MQFNGWGGVLGSGLSALGSRQQRFAALIAPPSRVAAAPPEEGLERQPLQEALAVAQSPELTAHSPRHA
ncbi:hypothetical protein GCM10008957_29940 [Deinococcus ruber]|uniref:Uncharacterized protein n=1 Tax=Deinococcus ruber TaxID=1848197 RepID=A0A918F8C4_9DEIO|nr:hypothetical protein GCM10008957_29940 [Deinococcus ruber]